MGVGLVSYIAIGVGVVILIAGSILKYILKKKVDDLEGFVGVIDEEEQFFI